MVVYTGAKEQESGETGQQTPAELCLIYVHSMNEEKQMYYFRNISSLLSNKLKVNECQILLLMKFLRLFALSSDQAQLHSYL